MADWTVSPLAFNVAPIDMGAILKTKSDLDLRRSQIEGQDLTNAAEREKQKLASVANGNLLLANAAGLVDPSDENAASKWDDAMQALADNGVGAAKQFVGRYSPALQRRVTSAYAAAAAPDSLSALQGDGSGPSPLTGAAGKDAQGGGANYEAAFANKTPEELAQTHAALAPIMQAARKVLASPNPVQTWNEEATRLGYPEMAQVQSPLEAIHNAQQMIEHDAPLDQYLTQRMADARAGVPVIKPPVKYENVGGVLYAIEPGKDPRAVTRPASHYASAGVDPMTGAPLLYDETTGKQVTAQEVDAMGGGAAGSAFVDKLIGTEKGSTPDAKNSLSSATGDGQFLKGTWLQLLRDNHPEIATGKSREELLAMRADPQLSRQMVAEYAQQNAETLTDVGQPANATTLAMAHKLGPGDAIKVLQAPPAAKLETLLSPSVMKANPQLKGETAGSYATELAQKFGVAPVPFGGEDALAATGDDFLKTLPPGRAAQVKAMVEGRMPPPSGAAMRSPATQALLAAAARYDPAFDLTTWQSRAATRKSFTAGADAANLTSLNTVIGHLDALNHSVDALHNSGFEWWNAAANTMAGITGDTDKQKALAKFNAAKETVASELVKALRGSGGAEADVKAWRHQIDASKSPQALKAAIAQAAELIDSRIDPLRQKYQQGMGTSQDPFVTIFPKAAAALERLHNLDSDTQVGAGAPPPPDQRVVGQVYQSPKGPVKWTGNGWVMASAAH